MSPDARRRLEGLCYHLFPRRKLLGQALASLGNTKYYQAEVVRTLLVVARYHCDLGNSFAAGSTMKVAKELYKRFVSSYDKVEDLVEGSLDDIVGNTPHYW